MEKQVFCLIGERCKSLKFIKNENVSDAEAIRNCLMVASKNDPVLQSMIFGKAVVLQRANPDRHNRLCDIDEDDEIRDKEDIHVLLIDLKLNNKSNIQLSEALATGRTLSIDVPVLQVCKEQDEHNLEIEDNERSIADQSIIKETEVEIIVKDAIKMKKEISPLVPETSEELPPPMKRQKINHLSVNENTLSLQSTSLQLSQSSYLGKSGSIPYPALLPKLTPELEILRSTSGLLANESSFVKFWSMHLQQLTEGYPTKADYLHYSKTIIDTYPELKAGKLGYEVIKRELSTCIRNRRAHLKKKVARGAHQSSSKSTTSALIIQNVCESTAIDIDSALKELQKNTNTSNTGHVRRLLQETLSLRRSWIKNEAKSIREITEKYPQLMEYNLILFELELVQKRSLTFLYQNIDTMLEKLVFYFEKDSDSTEELKCSVLCKLQEKLTRKQNKTVTPLFVVNKALSSTEDLISCENASPRVVLYTAEGGICAAFVVADTLRIKIPEPTVQKTLICLLGTYYAWDTRYPSAYENVMQYIDWEVLGTANKKACVDKFIRDIGNALYERNQQINK